MATCVATVLAAIGCSDDEAVSRDAAKPGEPRFKTTVDITRSGYQPKKLRVLVGGSVTFVNRDNTRPHTAQTAPSGLGRGLWDDEHFFDTHTLTWNEPYTVTLHKPGTLRFSCSFDQTMQGTIDVVHWPEKR